MKSKKDAKGFKEYYARMDKDKRDESKGMHKAMEKKTHPDVKEDKVLIKKMVRGMVKKSSLK